MLLKQSAEKNTQEAVQDWMDIGNLAYLTDTHEAKAAYEKVLQINPQYIACLLYTSPSPRDRQKSRMPSSA